MQVTAQLAKHLREVHTGGNWTAVNLKAALAGVDRQAATAKTGSLNTIAHLVYHIHYYTGAILNVFRGGPLDAHDKFSFDLPPLRSDADWESLVRTTLADAEALAGLVEQFPEERLGENFADPKYGSYYRNVCGLIEHTHYHLGQIVLLKKMLGEQAGKGTIR